MWYLLLSLAILVIVTIIILLTVDRGERWFGLTITWAVGVIVAGLLAYPTLRLTTGFYEGYSDGVREGFVTKLSTKGIIWKTNEGQLQVGTGAMAAIQGPWDFSIPDKFVPEVQASLGKKVRVHYTEFLWMPWRLGETDYLVTSVETIE